MWPAVTGLGGQRFATFKGKRKIKYKYIHIYTFILLFCKFQMFYWQIFVNLAKPSKPVPAFSPVLCYAKLPICCCIDITVLSVSSKHWISTLKKHQNTARKRMWMYLRSNSQMQEATKMQRHTQKRTRKQPPARLKHQHVLIRQSEHLLPCRWKTRRASIQWASHSELHLQHRTVASA